jgi:VWFA-related protein
VKKERGENRKGGLAVAGTRIHAAARQFVFVATLLALFVLGSLGQQAPQQPPLQHEVSVTLKLIQVYVTDKGGKPVRDLTRDEFKLTDNGKPVTLAAFEKHDLAAAPTAGVEAPAPEPASVLVPTEIPVLNRKFILFFDFAFNTGHGVKASIEAARRFIESTVAPGDELAVVSFSMFDGLKIHEFLTADHAKVKAALSSISSKKIAGRADEVEQAYWLAVDNPTLAPKGATIGGLTELDLARLDSMKQAGRYFRALTQFAQALLLVQGQKNIIFFSTGIPSSMVNASRGVGGTIRGSSGSLGSGGGEGYQGNATTKSSTFQVGNYELRPLQEFMLREFSASNCSLFSFDTRESSKIPSLFDVDIMATASGGNPLLGNNSLYRDDKLTGMDSLKKMSKETGGKYYSNIILHEKNLDEVSAVTGTYYVLGYAIPAVADGAYHKVGVEVTRKGCTVRTQPGYFNPKPFREFTDLEKDIHLFDLALNEKSELQAPKPLPVSALAYDAGQGGRVRALARIPAIVWAGLGGETAELVALFFDAQDSLVSLQRAAVTESDYDGKEILFSAGTAAGAGAVRCRVVLRDLDTGQSAVGSTTVYGGPANRQTLSVFTPLLLVRGGGIFAIEGVVKGAAEAPGWRDIYAYDPNALSPVVGGQAVGPGQVVVLLPYAAPGLAADDLVFSTNLVDSATGRSLQVPLELGKSATRGSVEVQTFEVGLEGVPEGRYILFVHVGNKLTNQVTSARVPLTVGR